MQSTWLIQFDSIRFDSIHCETNHHFVFAVWWNQHHVTMYKTIKLIYLWICNEKKAEKKKKKKQIQFVHQNQSPLREKMVVLRCAFVFLCKLHVQISPNFSQHKAEEEKRNDREKKCTVAEFHQTLHWWKFVQYGILWRSIMSNWMFKSVEWLMLKRESLQIEITSRMWLQIFVASNKIPSFIPPAAQHPTFFFHFHPLRKMHITNLVFFTSWKRMKLNNKIVKQIVFVNCNALEFVKVNKIVQAKMNENVCDGKCDQRTATHTYEKKRNERIT